MSEATTSSTTEFDLLLDDNWDIAIIDGDLAFTNTRSQVTKQRVLITLNTWQEEWFLDQTFGIPYRQQIFSAASRSKKEIDAIFIKEITDILLEDEQLSSYSSTFYNDDTNKKKRLYEASFTITTPNETIEIGFNTDRLNTQWAYPEPDADDPRSSCDAADLVSVLENGDPLFQYTNTATDGLSGTGDWWNDWSTNKP